MRDICDRVRKGMNYFIYGTAELGKYCADKLTNEFGDQMILGFIETSPPKGRTFHGKEVIRPEEAARVKDAGVILTGKTEFEQMRSNCINAGFKSQEIVCASDLAILLEKSYQGQVRKVAFWPEVTEDNVNLKKKIGWFIPDRIEVAVCSSCESFIADFNDNIKGYPAEEFSKQLDWADYILLWDFSKRGNLYEKYGDRVRIVDPGFYVNVDIINFSRLYYASFSAFEKAKEVSYSRMLFFEVLKEGSDYSSANVFCSGPSISELEDIVSDEIENGFNIICNSMVKDHVLMKRLKPKVLTFADSGFYISPTAYAKAFYEDLLEMYNEYHFYVIVPIFYRALILKHYPQIKDHIIGIPHSSMNGYWFPDERFSIRGLSNILTEYMIPIASSVSSKIGIFGCTGRNPDETYFWKHSTNTQYHDLMETVYDMWPSFFSWQKYDEYYATHCGHVENELRYGESKGKRYNNHTTSFIPALMRRTVNGKVCR